MDNCILRQGLIESLTRANASLQLLPKAAAQRRLEAVSCKALFGGVCRDGPVV